jgi:hypothetical protein
VNEVGSLHTSMGKHGYAHKILFEQAKRIDRLTASHTDGSR